MVLLIFFTPSVDSNAICLLHQIYRYLYLVSWKTSLPFACRNMWTKPYSQILKFQRRLIHIIVKFLGFAHISELSNKRVSILKYFPIGLVAWHVVFVKLEALVLCLFKKSIHKFIYGMQCYSIISLPQKISGTFISHASRECFSSFETKGVGL